MSTKVQQALMGAENVPPMAGSMILVMMGGLIGHLIFGITVAQFAKKPA